MAEQKVKKATTAKAAPKKEAEPKVAKKAAEPKAKKEISGKSITIKQVNSGAGRIKKQIQTLKGLGLNKVNKKVTLQDTPAIRGMIAKVSHLVEIVG